MICEYCGCEIDNAEGEFVALYDHQLYVCPACARADEEFGDNLSEEFRLAQVAEDSLEAVLERQRELARAAEALYEGKAV